MQAIERLWGKSRRRDECDVDVAVAPAETAMSQAADELRAEQLGRERLIPNETAGKIDRSGSREFVKITVPHR
jgi:hypothetical protein